MICIICYNDVNNLIICNSIKLNDHTKKYIKCNFSSCINCIKKYAIINNKYINCLQCNEYWSHEFLYNIFKDNNDLDFYFNDYIIHKQNILFNNFNNKLIINNKIKLFKLKQNYIKLKQIIELKNKLINFIKDIDQDKDIEIVNGYLITYIISLKTFNYYNYNIIKLYKYYYNEFKKSNINDINLIDCHSINLNNTINELFKIINSISIYNYNYYYLYYNDIINNNIYNIQYTKIENNEIDNETNKQIFNIKCSNNNCKGILNNENYFCIICDKYTCKDCHELKEENHICNINNKKSVELYMHDSKPCPKCKILIYRIEGCSMMFCTHCFTGFDWNTEIIYKNNIHNPHYFELMNNNDININLCGDININNKIIKNDKYILDIIQNINHISEIELNPTQIHGNGKLFNFNTNINDLSDDLIIQYKFNEIDINKVKYKLLIIEENYLKNIEINEIINVFIQSIRSIIYTYSLESTDNNRELYITKLNNIKNELNIGLYNISIWYNNNYYYEINNNYNILKNKK